MAASNRQKIESVSFDHERYVLALPGWYPTWIDPLPGDFNQRHIKAASLFTPQIVLYVGKDQTGVITETEVRINTPSNAMVEVVVVYPKSAIKWWDVLRSNFLFIVLLLKYSNIIKRRFGKPALLHSYIVMRGGLAGYLLSNRWKLPFILSENWTIYYPADPGYLPKRNFIFKWLVRKIMISATRFLPVTKDLSQQVQKLIGPVSATVIPNVVETEIFNRAAKEQSGTFVFVHVSTMIYQKNPEGLLRVFRKFNNDHSGTRLRLVGPYPDEILVYANSLGLTNQVEFTGAVDYKEVAMILQSSQAFVLFSRYENLPCVILEALCCGLPVISTTVGGIKEVIDEKNGILVESENEEQLLFAFKEMYANYANYTQQKIADRAYSLYSYTSVGKQINDVYEEVLNDSRR